MKFIKKKEDVMNQKFELIAGLACRLIAGL